MAKKEVEPAVDDTSEKVRSVLKKLVQNLVLIGAVVGLVWVVWVMAFRSDPRVELDTIEATVEEYTGFVQPYTASALVLPSARDVDYFLGFFDQNSRDFFRANFEEMARRRLVRDPERFEQLGREGRRGEAMLFLINFPPLGGIPRVVERRPADGVNRELVTVVTRDQSRRNVIFVQTSGRWLMEDFAGALPEIQAFMN